MRFIDIIIENSQEKISKLYKPAIKANENPENGITIQNKSAFYVIKDCAGIAKDYLPLLVFDLYKNPSNELKGKFNKKNIEEFLEHTKSNNNSKHLLMLIKNKIPKQETEIRNIQEIKDFDLNDPYGDYGVFDDTIQTNLVTMSDLDILCSFFGINS